MTLSPHFSIYRPVFQMLVVQYISRKITILNRRYILLPPLGVQCFESLFPCRFICRGRAWWPVLPPRWCIVLHGRKHGAAVQGSLFAPPNEMTAGLHRAWHTNDNGLVGCYSLPSCQPEHGTTPSSNIMALNHIKSFQKVSLPRRAGLLPLPKLKNTLLTSGVSHFPAKCLGEKRRRASKDTSQFKEHACE